MIELQAGGVCYSWRLPPLRWLGGGSVEARKKLVRRSGEVLCEGHCARPWEPRRATLVKRVIELPSLPWVGSCGARRAGLADDAN